MVGNGKIHSEKKKHLKDKENLPMEEATDGYDIIDKIKPTIENIKKVVNGGSEITGKEFTEWGKTPKKIVAGKMDSKTKGDEIAKIK
jgi:hypothetical protein